MFHDIPNACILPNRDHRGADSWIQWGVRIWIYLILQQVVAIVVILRISRLNLELPHRTDQGLGAVDEVFVNGQAIKRQFVSCVTVLVDDFHLFDNGRLPALPRTFWRLAHHLIFGWSCIESDAIPRSRILHSLRNLLSSSRSLASIWRLRFFFSSSSPFWEL